MNEIKYIYLNLTNTTLVSRIENYLKILNNILHDEWVITQNEKNYDVYITDTHPSQINSINSSSSIVFLVNNNRSKYLLSLTNVHTLKYPVFSNDLKTLLNRISTLDQKNKDNELVIC